MSNVQLTPAVQPAAQTPVAPPPKKEGRGLFGHIADVFIGGGEALWDVGKGLVTMVTHPIQTVKGIGYAVTHPAALYHAFVDPYTDAIAEGRPGKAIGRGIVEIGSLFLTGGSSGAVSGGAKGAGAAAKLGTAAKAGGKAAKLSEVAASAAKASKAAQAAGKASKLSKAGSVAARVASKPIFTKAAAAAAKNAGITEKVAQAALKASHLAYWEARAAGKTGAVARAAAAAKAAKIMGVSKNAAVVQKVVNGARLSGAAAQSAQIASKVSVATRISRAAAAARGIPSTVGTYLSKGTRAVKAMPAKLGAAAEKVGAITLKDVALAPFTLTKGALGSARGLIGGAWEKVSGKGAAAAGKAAKAGQAASKAGTLASAASKVGGMIKNVALAPFRMARGAAAGAYQAGKFIATHPRLYTPISLAGRGAAAGISALYGASGLSDEQIAGIAQQFNLDPSRANVEKFLKEIQTYQGNAIGPDSGSPEEVKQLQVILKALGHEVEPTGEWDEKTSQAVIDFKGQKGIGQTYLMADGTPGINEYVDEGTAQAIIQALKGGDAAETPAPATPGTETPAPATGGPVYTAYTVGQMDRASGLSGIARHYLGDASRWKEIYELNKELIGDNPNLILPGQKLRMPADAKGLPVEKAAAPAVPPADQTARVPAVPPADQTPKAAVVELAPVMANIAKQYGLAATADNVKAFVEEVGGYRGNAIGPDSGNQDDVLKLQRVLAALGHAAVKETGSFDDATAEAVIAFKQKAGLHQKYKLADGTWAINEYVDEAAARAMSDALK